MAVFRAWRGATGASGRTRLDPARRGPIERAYGWGYETEDLVDAVRGWRHDP
ncbi:MAG: hypothetical protein ACRD0J_13500 [Acidimicrobiales bacterium]